IEALNYQHVEWFGKTDFELWDTETASQFYANDQRVLSSDQALVTEEVTRQENHVQTWMMYKFPFHDSSGKRYLAGMAMDITEQRRLEQQGIELTVERERVHLITQFIQNASHEFRTPLTLIQYAAYWLENLEDGERRRREVEKI